jgi:hypothetical protein
MELLRCGRDDAFDGFLLRSCAPSTCQRDAALLPELSEQNNDDLEAQSRDSDGNQDRDRRRENSYQYSNTIAKHHAERHNHHCKGWDGIPEWNWQEDKESIYGYHDPDEA